MVRACSGLFALSRAVEEVLPRHSGVAECFVVGRHHKNRGGEVVVFVVNTDGQTVSVDDLDALYLARIAHCKRPKDYRFVTALAENNCGKVLKTELWAQLAAADRR